MKTKEEFKAWWFESFGEKLPAVILNRYAKLKRNPWLGAVGKNSTGEGRGHSRRSGEANDKLLLRGGLDLADKIESMSSCEFPKDLEVLATAANLDHFRVMEIIKEMSTRGWIKWSRGNREYAGRIITINWKKLQPVVDEKKTIQA